MVFGISFLDLRRNQINELDLSPFRSLPLFAFWCSLLVFLALLSLGWRVGIVTTTF